VKSSLLTRISYEHEATAGVLAGSIAEGQSMARTMPHGRTVLASMVAPTPAARVGGTARLGSTWLPNLPLCTSLTIVNKVPVVVHHPHCGWWQYKAKFDLIVRGWRIQASLLWTSLMNERERLFDLAMPKRTPAYPTYGIDWRSFALVSPLLVG
jgi:hypothetical protein